MIANHQNTKCIEQRKLLKATREKDQLTSKGRQTQGNNLTLQWRRGN